jgi:hypothetical protein
VSAKPSEAGLFWEWRTFGTIPDRIVRALSRCEVRGRAGIENEDLYFVSGLTEQNVKLRTGASVFKLKPLLVGLEDGLELYEESDRWIWEMPVAPEGVAAAASLLGVSLETSEPWSADRIRAAFKVRGGVISTILVRKKRTQYVYGGGWAEMAELEFPGGAVRTLGLQSRSLGETRRMRDMLDADRTLVPMNYVAACRKYTRG